LTIISSKASNFASPAICPGDLLDRIAFLARARVLQPRVGLEHEGVEMHPPLGLDPDMLEREVHQHRLAAPDPAPQIDARRTRLALAEQAEDTAAAHRSERASRSSAATARSCAASGFSSLS
jgi:hypothetical protein